MYVSERILKESTFLAGYFSMSQGSQEKQSSRAEKDKDLIEQLLYRLEDYGPEEIDDPGRQVLLIFT